MMICSICVPAYADDYETLVTYSGDGVSVYNVTVPATLEPGASGTVKVSGTWASDMVVEVSAPDTVTLTNSIDGGEKVLGIDFDGISQSGDNTNSILVSKTISVDEITNALFGTWSGTIIYTVTSTGGSGSTGSGSSSGSGNTGDSSGTTNPYICEVCDGALEPCSCGGFVCIDCGTCTECSSSDSDTGIYASNFADNDWSAIITACQNDEVPSTWSVGDTKPMTINGTEYNIQIIGEDHDVYSDGSGTAPLTFQLAEVYDTKYRMNTSQTNSTGWSGSAMRTTYLPTILSVMPEEISSAIKPVDKLTTKYSDGSPTLETTSDKLFLLSGTEIFSFYTYGKTEGSRYSYYADGASLIKEFDGEAVNWWVRGPSGMNDTHYALVSYTGTSSSNGANTLNGVVFGFCF